MLIIVNCIIIFPGQKFALISGYLSLQLEYISIFLEVMQYLLRKEGRSEEAKRKKEMLFSLQYF
ncbi:hypothetical protein D5R40_10355 [Okeania hirsuta]|uniref:Uncharacterized protein n=1 Tax=Okeania hirsuta TaxID=1458930 RepID=A0A3N6PEE7_9CYAN|nr:hypothetical protein D4Z78_24475 [Okeania hirsuta]RQH45708.1 hypothetical protein D5R40_10355 [Okeania hirsuta]